MYMISRVVLTTLLIISSTLAFSQFSFGVKAGLNYTNLRRIDTEGKFNYVGKSDWLPTFHFGVFGNHLLSERSSLVWEVQYSDKGYKTSDFKEHLGYLTSPLLFRYKVYKKLSLEAGAEFGLLLFTYGEYAVSKDSYNFQYGTIDWGLNGGIHYDLSDQFSLGFRYTHGIGNVLNKDWSITSLPNGGGATTTNFYDNGLRYKNQTLQLSVGYRLHKLKAYESQNHSLFYIPQNERRVVTSVGFRLGSTNYTMYGSEVEFREKNGAKLTSRTGIEIATEVRFDVYKYFYGTVGASLLQKGGHIAGGNWTYQDPVELNYISLPVLLGISPIKTKPFTFSLEAGLAYNYLLSYENTYSKDVVTGYYSNQNNKGFSKVFGGEVSTDAINSVTLFLNYRKTEDLNFFHERVYSLNNTNKELWNRGYSISFGVRLKGKNSPYNNPSSRGVQIKNSKDSVMSPFSIGLKLGANFNNTFYKDLPSGEKDESKTLIAPHLGMYFRMRLGKHFAFTPEVQYTQKGYKFRNDENDEISLHMDYIEHSFLLAYSPIKQISIEAGPVVGLWLDSKCLGGDGSSNRYQSYDEILELGLSGGLRFNISESFSIAGRYYRGQTDISNLYDYADGINIGNTKEYNSNIQVSTYFKLFSSQR